MILFKLLIILYKDYNLYELVKNYSRFIVFNLNIFIIFSLHHLR